MEGLELKVKRIRTGLKQYQLASRLGISSTQLCEIESGRRQPSRELSKRIERALGLMCSADR